MSIQNKPWLAACLLLLPFQVALADLPADRLVTEPDTGFDITPAAAPQVEAAPAPANAQPDKRLQMSREELLQRPELLQQALSYAVLTHNAEGASLLLPIYLELPGPHDALLVALAQALIARAEGDYQRAIGLYRAVLAADPDIPPVRLSLAQSLFENRADKDARQEFEHFRQTPNLAPELQQLAGQYLEALRKRDRWSFGGSVNFISDSNVNNAGREREIRTPRGVWTLPEPESAQGFAYRLNADRDWNVHGNLYWRLSLDDYGKFYWNNHKFDDQIARLSSGPAYKTARAEAAVTPYYERRWYGTHKYSREVGVRAEWQYWLTPRHKILSALEIGEQRHDRRRWLDGDSYTASGTWLFVRSPTQYFSFGLDWLRKTAEDNSESYTRKGLRLGWTQQWGWGLTTSAQISAGHRSHDAPDLFRITRRDHELAASLVLSHRKLQFAGITPQLVGTWQRVNSNHFFYPYRKGNVFIQFGRSF